MKITKFLAAFGVLALALVGQSTASLTATCQIAGNPSYPDCVDGEVTFSGSGFTGSGGMSTVNVVNGKGTSVDNSPYNLSGNSISFTENLSIPDTYSIYVDGTLYMTVTTNGKN